MSPDRFMPCATAGLASWAGLWVGAGTQETTDIVGCHVTLVRNRRHERVAGAYRDEWDTSSLSPIDLIWEFHRWVGAEPEGRRVTSHRASIDAM